MVTSRCQTHLPWIGPQSDFRKECTVSADWQNLTRAEKKLRLEAEIGEALEGIETEGREPTEWESQHLAGAIGSADDGLFEVAASDLNQVFEDEANISPNWHKQEGLCDMTTSELRAALNRLKARPVQERPIFHKVLVGQ
jgi:hypothetical protein